ncbi:uncharacterized protein E0L32_011801 [Thyridium curvatum]|uniref:N-acetyltransferase domain-containing protein n=1 Tax=Thyridium curvatum TaxID=1093900 RepID=A0A507BFM9_9PEZI|nr:uncharacterized protein E0L32_011801 [Thyridium curvatum]TPX18303.1 hypothetical protein E0L32_011801 [Thyridium curvatum]
MAAGEVTFRSHRPGDIGWVIYRHGVLYCDKWGWDPRFEGLVARIMATFLDNYDPDAERGFIAEQDGKILGCIFVVKEPGTEACARLRVLLVEPEARGLGLGKQLVQKSVDFAREKNYKKVILSTQSVLTPARQLYTKIGFKRLYEETGHFTTPESKGEVWELEL